MDRLQVRDSSTLFFHREKWNLISDWSNVNRCGLSCMWFKHSLLSFKKNQKTNDDEFHDQCKLAATSDNNKFMTLFWQKKTCRVI